MFDVFCQSEGTRFKLISSHYGILMFTSDSTLTRHNHISSSSQKGVIFLWQHKGSGVTWCSRRKRRLYPLNSGNIYVLVWWYFYLLRRDDKYHRLKSKHTKHSYIPLEIYCYNYSARFLQFYDKRSCLSLICCLFSSYVWRVFYSYVWRISFSYPWRNPVV